MAISPLHVMDETTNTRYLFKNTTRDMYMEAYSAKTTRFENNSPDKSIAFIICGRGDL